MSNAVASTIFTLRNADKAFKTHNPLRGGVAIANGTKVAGAISHSTMMKSAANVAGKVVNPLLIMSCGYNVYKSDDKVKTAAKEGLGLAGMFLFENQMKHGSIGKYTEKGAKWLMEKLSSNAKTQNIGTKIMCGLAFVTASILGYDLASKAGEKAVDLIRKSAPENIEKNCYDNYKLTENNTLDEKA